MDADVKVVTLDWRQLGDFSAVGQLTKKIFSAGRGISVHSLQCLDDGPFCNLFTFSTGRGLQNVFGHKIAHDAALNHVRQLEPDALYLRLSPHKGVLEFATKLVVTLPHVPLIVHYMDKPSFVSMSVSRKAYIVHLYRFLVLRADSIYAIHESSLPWLREEYAREARVLANFINVETPTKNILNNVLDRPIQISYFGSIDLKMNAGAIASVCRAVSNLPWVRLSIWSNSGIWGDVKEIYEASSNIEVFVSNLEDLAFKVKLAEADLLLLPYNLDVNSLSFLKHSFSNKFVDYLEAGGVILCVGSPEIPTVQSCKAFGLSLVLETEAEISSVFLSKDALLSRLSALDLEQYESRIKSLRLTQTKRLEVFFEDIKSHAAVPPSEVHQPCENTSKCWTGEGLQQRQLAFLIRRKFFDLVNGQQQSLSSTLMAQIIKSKGYRGFDYEI